MCQPRVEFSDDTVIVDSNQGPADDELPPKHLLCFETAEQIRGRQRLHLPVRCDDVQPPLSDAGDPFGRVAIAVGPTAMLRLRIDAAQSQRNCCCTFQRLGSRSASGSSESKTMSSGTTALPWRTTMATSGMGGGGCDGQVRASFSAAWTSRSTSGAWCSSSALQRLECWQKDDKQDDQYLRDERASRSSPVAPLG